MVHAHSMGENLSAENLHWEILIILKSQSWVAIGEWGG